MSIVEIRLPKLGESIVSATIVTWLVAEGQEAVRDQPLVEVSTDKVNSEIPAPVGGKLIEIVAQENDLVEVGDLIARIETGGEAMAAAPAQEAVQGEGKEESVTSTENQSVLSPAVLRLATEHGLSMDEIMREVKGTGEGGRISKRDLLSYVERKGGGSLSCEGERIKMSALRKAIADNMVRSFYAAPHASLVQTVDMSALLAHVVAHKESFLSRHGVKLSVTSFVAKAICHALKEFPWLNSSLEGDTIVVKPRINLGIAVGIEGGVVVPVIRDCHERSIAAIAKEIADLGHKARSVGLTGAETSHGTITLTNFGMSGVEIGVPIIRFPEVAIVGMGAVKKVAGFDAEGAVVPRDQVYLSLTFDHRVLDGMYGCGFLSALGKALEEEALSWSLE